MNNKLKQQGNSQDTLFPRVKILAGISNSFSLLPSDMIIVVTSKGSVDLSIGDQLTIQLSGHFSVKKLVFYSH